MQVFILLLASTNKKVIEAKDTRKAYSNQAKYGNCLVNVERLFNIGRMGPMESLLKPEFKC